MRAGGGGVAVTRVGIILSAALVTLVACGSGGSSGSPTFDGQSFRTKLSTERGTRDEFVVTARPASASLAGAREAARYEATVYCVNRYGSSDITWIVGPDSPDTQLTIREDTLILQGRCPQ